ncbi:hypothetical protein AMTR_s00067p00084570 [Amborella trichopoda]|uniref:Pentatricopeptide repeat-containing protein n=1 Tax=Amborella trichopoda TaxID=13333 RepID=U5DBI7_AMBTC|nr:hypothetical protein AMTR_s00067p00084570 [Amborella trichopoda]
MSNHCIPTSLSKTLGQTQIPIPSKTPLSSLECNSLQCPTIASQVLFLKLLLDKPKSPFQAKQIHAQILRTGLHHVQSLMNRLVALYSSLGLLNDASSIFVCLSSPSSLSWRSMVKGHSSHGLFDQSLFLFSKMRANGVHPDHHIFPSVLKSCAGLMDLKLGESIHGCAVRLGFDHDLYIGNALMAMYSKCCSVERKSIGIRENGSILYAPRLNDEISQRELRVTQQSSDEIPQERKRGVLGIGSVIKVFDRMPHKDLVSWNTVICGHAQNGSYKEALAMVREIGLANLKPDSFTLSSVLPIFAEHVEILHGKEIHGFVIRHGFEPDVFIASSLIDMYAKCTRIHDAHRIFLLMPNQDCISWNSMIAGFVQNGFFNEALQIFHEMQTVGIKPMAACYEEGMVTTHT